VLARGSDPGDAHGDGPTRAPLGLLRGRIPASGAPAPRCAVPSPGSSCCTRARTCRWRRSLRTRSPTASRWGRAPGARCSRSRRLPPAMRDPVRRQARQAASVCMPVWRRVPINAASSSGCAAPSAARRCRRHACRSPRADTSEYQLKTPYRDGTHVLFEPPDFIARLAALVPKPRVNLTRYHGVLAPNSAHRAQVTKAGRGRGARRSEDSTPAKRRASMSWAQRLKRVFNIDLETKRGVRRGDAHHRLHRRPGDDREDPRPPRCQSGCGAGCPAAAVPGAARAAVRLRRSSVFPSCCGRLEASAGDRLRARSDTVRIAATASGGFGGRGGGGRDFTHRGWTRGPAPPLCFALD
jgi:Putative transposase